MPGSDPSEDDGGPRVIEFGSLSHTGLQRSHNEDAFGELRRGDGLVWLMVADGMGGHAGGETASRTAVETVREVVERGDGASETLLRNAFEEANRAIHSTSLRDARLHGMGTTGVSLLLSQDGGSVWVANVGDSRAYRLRGGCLEQLTDDHSFVAELMRRGVIDAEQAAVHPRRHQLLRSLGIDADVEVDVGTHRVEHDDRFLLCSDGLSGVVSDEEIVGILAEDDLDAAARRLVDLANERGGPDNITVQIARIRSGSVGSPDGGAEAWRLRVGRAVVILGLAMGLGIFWIWLGA